MRSRQHKAKAQVERTVRTGRGSLDPASRAWDDAVELRATTDAGVEKSARRRRCPVTGSGVWESWQDERLYLAPLMI